MKPIFISGSSKIHELNAEMKDALNNVIKRNIPVLVGDCFGVDSLVQRYLNEQNYTNVTVYCSGSYPRCYNNKFQLKHCVDKTMSKSGRDFYEIKDIQMTEDCAGALMFWDGKSIGTKNNIERCRALNKNYKIIKA